MDNNPFEYARMTNSIRQTIIFLEHPFEGDEADVICACPELSLASNSGFKDTGDMLAEHGEYEPKFIDGKFKIG